MPKGIQQPNLRRSNDSESTVSSSNFRVATWLSVALLFLFHIVRTSHDLIHPDVAWYLYGTERLLQGAKLYHDIVDINPPLIYLLNTSPVWLAGVLGIPATAMYKTFMLILAGLMVYTCSRVIQRVLASTPCETWEFILVLCGFLLVSLAGGNFGYIGTSFGQREHIMLLLTMPYLLAAIGRAEGFELPRGLRLLTSALAALGLAIKPHFMLAWLMVEAYLVIMCKERQTWKRGENIIIVSVLGLYWMNVAVFTPEYFVLALKVVHVYSAYNASFWVLLTQGVVVLWAVAFVVLWLLRSNETNKQARTLLFIAGTGFLIAALLQRKGWGYQFYPARAALFASIGFSLDAVYERFTTHRLGGWFTRKRLATVMIVVMLVLASRPSVDSLVRPVPGLAPAVLPFVNKHAEGGGIVVLSTTSDPQFPLVEYAGVRWSSRYSELWFLPALYADVAEKEGGVYPYHRPTLMGSLEREFYENVIHDLLESPPELILNNVAEERYPIGRSRFNFIEYYCMDRRFNELFEQYHRIGSVGGFDIYKRQLIDMTIASNQR